MQKQRLVEKYLFTNLLHSTAVNTFRVDLVTCYTTATSITVAVNPFERCQ